MHMRAYPTELDGKRGEREASRRQFMLSQQAEDARRREMQQQAWERGTATGACTQLIRHARTHSVGKSQSCMFEHVGLIVHAPAQ